jgi:hypothetical protein
MELCDHGYGRAAVQAIEITPDKNRPGVMVMDKSCAGLVRDNPVDRRTGRARRQSFGGIH